MHATIYTNNYRRNLELYWRQFYPHWKVPSGYHVHHIKPKSTYADKNDPRIHHPRNLIALHPDDHASIHRCRGDLRSANGGFMHMRDYKHSEETKSKMKESAKHRPPQTQASRNKRSIAMKGKSKSPEHVAKMVQTRTARNNWGHSDETKLKMSIANSGTANGMYNKKHSDESRAQMSATSKSKSKEANLKSYSRIKSDDEIIKQKATKSSPQWIKANTTICPHCHRAIKGKSNFNRWHGDKCRV